MQCRCHVISENVHFLSLYYLPMAVHLNRATSFNDRMDVSILPSQPRSRSQVWEADATEWTVYSRSSRLHLMCNCACYHWFSVTIIHCGICSFLICVPLMLERRSKRQSERWNEKFIYFLRGLSIPHGGQKHIVSIHIKLWFSRSVFALLLSPSLHLFGRMGREWVRERESRMYGIKKSR